ncbi:hypothetical protein BASA83_003745 [Batrachochytrium salamandrivorans]|nr:hypothetical protein BASA83_003745 [Batrachochytrium salamandrivorans]
MRLSTGIILSILSTNVFAIEHRNGAHPSSLLARRAVVADTDGPFLQKRSANCVYVKGNFGEDLYPTPNYNDDTGESNTYSPTYDSNQDRGATGGREDVHTDVDPDQEESSFTDASQGSSFQVLGHIRKGLSHVKHRPGLVHRLNRALTTFKQVWRHIGGNGGRTIGWHIYSMFIHALYRSHEYKLLYKNSAESPFILKLPSSASDEQRRIYKSLQDEVHKSIKDHISAIMHAVDRIFTRPGSVVLELESIISSADRFYVFISNIRSEYSGCYRH